MGLFRTFVNQAKSSQQPQIYPELRLQPVRRMNLKGWATGCSLQPRRL